MKKFLIALVFYLTLSSNNYAQSWVANTIHCISFQDNFIWVSNALGVMRFSQSDTSNIVTYPYFYFSYDQKSYGYDYQYDQADNFVIDKKNNVWFGGKFGGSLYKYEGDSTFKIVKRNYSEIKGLGKSWYYDGQTWSLSDTRMSRGIFSLLIDNNDNIWISSLSPGIEKYDGSNWTTLQEKDGLISNSINEMSFDKDFNLWCTSKKGVSKFNGSKFTNYTVENGLIDNNTNLLFIDGKNRIWVGSKKGVSCFENSKWVSYSIENGLISNKVNLIKMDNKGQIWFGTNKGLSCFDGSKWFSFTKINGLLDNDIQSLAFDNNNNPWVGTWKGVSFFNGSVWKNYSTYQDISKKQEVCSNCIRSIIIKTDGIVWIESGCGVYSFDGNQWKLLSLVDLAKKYPCDFKKKKP